MLVIRKNQKEDLKQLPVGHFEKHMAGTLLKYFPMDVKMLGRKQILKIIRLGTGLALKSGFHDSALVTRYICLMFMFGSRFGEDLQYPELLKELNGPGDPFSRMENLYDKAARILRHIAGEHGEYYRRSLAVTGGYSLGHLLPEDKGDPDKELNLWLRTLHREKYFFMQKDLLDHLIFIGTVSAGRHGLSTRKGQFIYIGLMFMLGSFFDRDPLYPWAENVLGDNSMVDPEQRAGKLYQAGMDQLKRYTGRNRP